MIQWTLGRSQVAQEEHVPLNKKEFIEGVHFYLENGKVVFTEKYHLDRGHCCGSKGGCRHCPYEPKGIKNNTVIKS
jgi:hypothetical protein